MNQPTSFRWFVGLLSLAFSAFGAGPDNDHFKDRFTLSGVETSAAIWVLDATIEPNEPNHAVEPYRSLGSAWWTWTAPADGFLELGGSGHRVTIYRGDSLASLVRVAEPQATTGNVPQFRVSQGETLQIAVCGWQAPGQPPVDPLNLPTVLHLKLHPIPTNDHFENRRRMAGTVHRLTGNMGGASQEAGEPRHGFVGLFASLWWEWTPTISGLASINYVLGGRADMVHLYRGTRLSELIPIPPEEGHPFAVKAGEPVQIAIATEVWPEIGPTLGAFEVRAVASDMRLVTPVGGLVLDRPGSLPLEVEGAPEGAGNFAVELNGRERIFLSLSATNLIVPHLGVGKHRLHVVSADSWGAEFYTPEELVLVQSGADTFQQAPGLPIVLDGAVWMSSVGGDFSRAVRDADEPPPAVGTVTESGTIWWHWRCTAAGRLIFGGANAQPDVRYANVEAFVGSGLENLSRLETSEVSGWYATARGIPVELGRDYWLRLTHSGPAPYDWAEVPVTFQSVAPGDVFADAVPLPSDEFVVPLPAHHTTFEPDEPGQRNSDFGSRWFIVRPAGDSLLNLEVAPWHVADTPLEFFMGENLATLIPVAGPTKYLTTRLAGGQTYWAKLTVSNGFRASDEAWVVGFLGLRPPNDDFAQSITIPSVAEGVVAGSNRHATTESGQPESLGFDQSVWFKFTAPEQGALVVRTEAFDNPNGILPRLIFARGSQLSNLTPAAEQIFGSTGQAIELDAGEQVFLMLSGPNHVLAAHSFALHYQFVTRPPNDDFSGRVVLAGTRVNTRGTNWLASREADEPLASPRASGRSAWWEWKASANGLLDVNCPGLVAELFTGTTLNNLIRVPAADAATNFIGGLRFPVSKGNTYQLRVDRRDSYSRPEPFTPTGLGGFELGLRLTSLVLTSPSNGVAWPANVPLVLTLGESNPALAGEITGVSFRMWTNPFPASRIITVGAVFHPPYQLNLGEFPPGNYQFQAVATNAVGETIPSQVVAVRITPVNDAFAQATPLSGRTFTNTVIYSGATAEPGEPSGVSGGRGSIWYRWEAPASGTLRVILSPTQAAFSLYTGQTLSTLRLVSPAGAGSLPYQVTAGTVYLMRIVGRSEVLGMSNATEFRFALETTSFALPVSDAQVSAGQSLLIRVQTSESPANLAGVILRAGTNLLATLTSAPWEIVWANPAPGRQILSATVTDPSGDAIADAMRAISVAPPNDLLASSVPMVGMSGEVPASTVGASSDLAGDPRRLVWYAWTAPLHGLLRVRPVPLPSSPRFSLALFAGTDPASWKPVANRLSGELQGIAGQWEVEAGKEYRLGFETGALFYEGALEWELEPPAPNDAFAARIPLEGEGGTVTASWVLASLEPGDPFDREQFSLYAPVASVWWSWTPPVDGLVEITLPATGAFTFHESAVVLATAGSVLGQLQLLGDPFTQPQFAPERRFFPVSAGVPVHLALLHRQLDVRNLPWEWRFRRLPTNDQFDHRHTLESGVPANGSTLGATLGPVEPPFVVQPHNNVWWSWTAPSDGVVRFQLSEFQGSQVLDVFKGASPEALEAIARYSIGTPGSATEFLPVGAGETVHVMVGSQSSPGSDFRLVAEFNDMSRPANDDFAQRRRLTGENFRLQGANWRTTREFGEPIHAGRFGGRSVWYAWQAPSDGEVTLTPLGEGFPKLLLATYQGDVVSQLATVAAVDYGEQRTPLRFPVRAGREYVLAVDGDLALTTEFELELKFADAESEAPRLNIIAQPDGALLLTSGFVPLGTWAFEESFDLAAWAKVADVQGGGAFTKVIAPAFREGPRFFRLRRLD